MKLLRHPLVLALIVTAVLAGLMRSFTPPEPLPVDAPDNVFSAERAYLLLEDLLREGQPHVSGSPLNDTIRQRIASHLEFMGYEVEIQQQFACHPEFGSCADIKNIIAMRAGFEGKNAVLLTSHYDSGWAGPGAADDGAGTAAILEIARMARMLPEMRNDVIFLISDAEELGLIGAQAFAEEHPLFEKVKAVINLEARGVSGPSAMFETGDGNRRMIRLLADHVERPVANSLTYEVYRRMPNDTDYSVYKSRGVMGVNFAFSGGVALYHSADDTPRNLDRGSLQHHGDNAWAMLKALGDWGIHRLTSWEDAGYTDIFGYFIIRYPYSIASGVAIVFGVFAFLAILLAYRREIRPGELFWSLLGILLPVVALLLSAWLLSWPLGRWLDLHPIEHPYPWPTRLALLALLGLCSYGGARLLAGRLRPGSTLFCGWMIIAAAALWAGQALPGAAFVFLLPLLAFAGGSVAGLLLRRNRPPRLLLGGVLGFAAVCYTGLLLFLVMETVLNAAAAHLRVVPLVLLLPALIPLLAGFAQDREESLPAWPLYGLAALLVAAVLAQVLLPGFTPDRPRAMTLAYVEDPQRDESWLTVSAFGGRADADYIDRYGFSPETVAALGAQGVERPALAKESQELPEVVLAGFDTTADGTAWRHRYILHVPEGVPSLRMILPEGYDLTEGRVNGALARDPSIASKHQRPREAIQLAYPRSPVVVELLSGHPQPPTIDVWTAWPLSPQVVEAYQDGWPANARPAFTGHNAMRLDVISGSAAEP